MPARSPQKSGSYPNLTTNDDTPISQRFKRKLPDFSDEFRQFKEDMQQMFSAWTSDQDKKIQRIENRLINIQSHYSDIEKTLEFITNTQQETIERVASLEKKNKDYEVGISNLRDEIENLHRNAKISFLELRNVPTKLKEPKEELADLMVKLGKAINLNLCADDIKNIYRVPGTNKVDSSKPIIVELKSVELKQNIIKATKSYNLRYKDSKLNATNLGFNKNTPIFVAEHLTPHANRLYFLGRDLVKSKLYKYCWPSLGRIFVKKTDDSPAILVKFESQVLALKSV